MPEYRNGFVDESLLVIFQRGWNSTDGDWYWGLTPAAYARHQALLKRAFSRTERWLSPSDGWGTYRPFTAQVKARQIYGNGAAVPGTSSHGMYWEGRQVSAVDYSNWGWVYEQFGGSSRAEFYADCRAVGLEPGMISEDRGYPDEPWHVVDPDPWGPVPAGGEAVPLPVVEEPKVEYDMIAVTCPTLLEGWMFLLAPGYVKNAPGDQAHNYASITSGKYATLTRDEMIWEMWNHGLGEVFTSGTPEELQAFLHSLENGKFYVASWLRTNSPAPTSITAADQQAIASLVKQGLSFPTPKAIAVAVNDDAAKRLSN